MSDTSNTEHNKNTKGYSELPEEATNCPSGIVAVASRLQNANATSHTCTVWSEDTNFATESSPK